jgi:hypothetical protein
VAARRSTTWSCRTPTAIGRSTRRANCRRTKPRPARGVREGLSRMRCKAHGRFLGEGVRATSPPYPTGRKALAFWPSARDDSGCSDG